MITTIRTSGRCDTIFEKLANTVTGGVSSVLSVTTLWTNEDPTSVFAAQDLPVETSPYKWFLITYYWSIEYAEPSDNATAYTQWVPFGIKTRLPINSTLTNRVGGRDVTVSDGCFTFGTSGYNGTTDSSKYAIPYQIFGLETYENTDDNDIAKEISQIKDEINNLHPLTISSVSITPGFAEKGSTVENVEIYYTVNRSGATVTVDGVSSGSSPYHDYTERTGNHTYTVYASLDSATVTKTVALCFVAPIYYGVSETYYAGNSTVLALSKVMTQTRSFSFTVYAASGQYILFALPVSLGTPTFTVGGFSGGFRLENTFDFTNSSGHTESYRLYRSVNAGLGSTTVVVS